MADDLGALTLLGESADWLKDADNVSIRDHRLAAIEAYRASWSHPTREPLLVAMHTVFDKLILALRHNHLYPEGISLGAGPNGQPRYLPRLDSLRRDFDKLRDFCVVNRFGIGEIHLLLVVLGLVQMLHEPQSHAYDQLLEEAVGDVVFLRVPIFRADNLCPFSTELQARLHAARLLRAMQRLGLFDDSPVAKLTPQEQSEVAALLADKLRPDAAKMIQRRHQTPFRILDTATALDAYSRAHAANRAPADDRTPEELFVALRHSVSRLARDPHIGGARRERLTNLGVASVVRAIAHVDTLLGKKMYAFLRSGRRLPTVHHSRMFRLLPNNAERLAFLNFLYTNGTQNPVYYKEKFERYFQGDKLRFVRKEIGFHLDRKTEEKA